MTTQLNITPEFFYCCLSVAFSSLIGELYLNLLCDDENMSSDTVHLPSFSQTNTFITFFTLKMLFQYLYL